MDKNTPRFCRDAKYNLFPLKESFQLAVARGVAMCPKIPFCKPFYANNLQQVAKATLQSGEYPHFDTVWPPF